MNASEERVTSGDKNASDGPQHLQALQRANAVRLARAELKRRIAEGEVTVAEVVLGSPWEAESMTISDLLMSQRRWGTTRCRKFLQCVQISENKPVGSMTDRQRRALAQMLGAIEPCQPRIRDARPGSTQDMQPLLAGVA
jgi:hypothetical protein